MIISKLTQVWLWSEHNERACRRRLHLPSLCYRQEGRGPSPSSSWSSSSRFVYNQSWSPLGWWLWQDNVAGLNYRSILPWSSLLWRRGELWAKTKEFSSIEICIRCVVSRPWGRRVNLVLQSVIVIWWPANSYNLIPWADSYILWAKSILILFPFLNYIDLKRSFR